MTEVSLRVRGRTYRGWKTARVTRTIEAACGSFDLSVSERWANQDQAWPIFEEDECEIYLGTTKVITGYVDSRRPSFAPGTHSISVAGRDKAADLVDCSVLLQGNRWEFVNVSVLALAQKICQPYGITVRLQSGLTPAAIVIPKKLSIDPGDTALNSLEAICRLSGLLIVSDGNGGIVLTRAGTERCPTTLVEGENVLAGEAEYDFSGRFSSYLVLGQHKGSDEVSGADSAGVSGSARDANVRRTARTLVIRPETSVSKAMAKKRAEWEATHRAARSESFSVTVQGWTQPSGSLWPVNQLARLTSPLLGVNGDMLISEVTHDLSVDSGSTTTLKLKPPDAFKPEPILTKAGTSLWKEIARGV